MSIIIDGTNGITTPAISAINLPFKQSNGTETLTATDMGKIIRTHTASTLTLPLLSSVSDGAIIGFQLNAGVEVTVQRQGTDELSWSGNASLNTVKLTKYGDYLFFAADKLASRWRVVSEGITGPAFVATTDVSQAIAISAAVKLQFNIESEDTHGCYDPINYRFTPSIPGYYIATISAYTTGPSRVGVALYKNGNIYSMGSRVGTNSDEVNAGGFVVYMNGTTDYIEAYCLNSVDAAITFNNVLKSVFSATRIR